MRLIVLCLVASLVSSAGVPGCAPAAIAGRDARTSVRSVAPYPPSNIISGLQWDWSTHRKLAPGSDLWPVTWASDGNLYAAWGDGGGFGGTDSDGRVSMGFARLEGSPP